MHAHIFIAKKTNESYKIVRFWQGFLEKFCDILKGVFALYFLAVSFFSCFDHFIGVFDYSFGWSMLRFKYSDDAKF